jgi:L-lactate dehydrogenase
LRGGAAAGETRLQLLKRNAAIFADVVPKVVAAAPDAVLVAASNPVDLMTDLTAKIAGLRPGRVFRSGTMLDSARLRALVGEHVGVASSSVHANVLGEHGDSEVLVWSSIQVGVFPLASFAEQIGRPVTDPVKQQIDQKVHRAADHIIEGKGATYFGVAASLARITHAIRHDEKAVLTLTAPGDEKSMTGEVCLSLPRILGSKGIEATLRPSLTTEWLHFNAAPRFCKKQRRRFGRKGTSLLPQLRRARMVLMERNRLAGPVGGTLQAMSQKGGFLPSRWANANGRTQH